MKSAFSILFPASWTFRPRCLFPHPHSLSLYLFSNHQASLPTLAAGSAFMSPLPSSLEGVVTAEEFETKIVFLVGVWLEALLYGKSSISASVTSVLIAFLLLRNLSMSIPHDPPSSRATECPAKLPRKGVPDRKCSHVPHHHTTFLFVFLSV